MMKTPADLSRDFAAAFARRDGHAVAALCVPDADFLSLTGAWAEGREAIAEVMAEEFAGLLAEARLVTGRSKQRALGPHGAVMLQRYVVSGLRHPDGSDAGRQGAVLAATLVASVGGWLILSASFTASGAG